MVKNVIKKIGRRIRQRFVLSFLFEKLAVVGIKIDPYYVTQEFHLDEMDRHLNPQLQPIQADFLSFSEIEKIYSHPESKWLNVEKRKNLEDGCLCFGLKWNNEIVAYTWCNLSRCHEVYPFPLKEDEAYLTGAFTFKAYRGKNLAPFMRYRLNRHLYRIGRTKIYSLTHVFNTPAIKFKTKIKAKPLKIILSIKLFKKYDWKFMIRSPKHFTIPI
jgi:hypothetical protein